MERLKPNVSLDDARLQEVYLFQLLYPRLPSPPPIIPDDNDDVYAIRTDKDGSRRVFLSLRDIQNMSAYINYNNAINISEYDEDDIHMDSPDDKCDIDMDNDPHTYEDVGYISVLNAGDKISILWSLNSCEGSTVAFIWKVLAYKKIVHYMMLYFEEMNFTYEGDITAGFTDPLPHDIGSIIGELDEMIKFYDTQLANKSILSLHPLA